MLSMRFSLAARAIARAASACALCLLFASPAAVAGSSGLTLHDATRLAVARAPMLDARNAGVSAAREEAARAGALPDPMLMLGIDNLPVTGPDAFEFGPDEMTMKRVGVRQEVPARAKREAQRTLAARKVDEARALSAATELEVQRATGQAWVDVWAAQQELDALRALREQAVSAAELTKARLGGGTETAGDALATASAVLEVDNRIEAARATRESAQATLARWLGDDIADLSTDAPDFGFLRIPEARLLASIDRLGPLLPATAQVRAAEASIELARAEKKSDWSVGASYGQRERGRSDMLMVEIGFGLPLFTRNRQDRGVAAREADHQAAVATREDLRREAIARIRSELARWQGFKRQVALHEDSLLPLARDRSAAALAAYEAGGAVQSWLDAQRAELEVHLSHAERLGELGRAWVALAYLIPTEARP